MKSPMDLANPVIRLCVASTQAEFEKRLADARALSLQAFEAVQDDFDACIAAHYVARYQEDPQSVLEWNETALRHAQRVGDESVRAFYPSLYVNLGHAHEVLGNLAEARRYYDLAANLGLVHPL
jgi:hypothetical protein